MAEASMFDKWHGLDRKSISWGPIVDASKCTGCGLCVVTCGEKRNVFGFDVDKKKSVVMLEDHCMVGCNNCAVGCLWDAISFPNNDDYVRELAKRIPKEALAKELKAKLEANPELVFD